MDGETCATCRFWSRDIMSGGESEGRSGECRRRSPHLILSMAPEFLKSHTSDPDGVRDCDGEEDARRIFPLTYNDDWCGEHQPKRTPLPVVEGGAP